LAAEWVVMGYLVLTTLLLFFTYTKVHNPQSMLWGRVQVVAMTAVLWGVYRLLPCRLTVLARISAQLALLSWWYPDTYEFNRMFPNLDHLFAGYEQSLLGCQPALTFAQQWSHPVVSELMHLGYSSYFPLIAVVTLYYFCCRYADLQRAAFVIIGSFFIYYIIFIFLPVTGPQYYYLAAGTEQIAAGVFPNVGDWFATHQEMMPLPGYPDGFFYHLVSNAHAVGERPTAAFPSSHVGVTTILALLSWRSGSRRLLALVLTLLVIMCFSTVYIQAHYVIDVFAGLLSGLLLYASLYLVSARLR
jgi:membrane-associated phospholipid phosphatase